jgi:glycosyltransferase involved in cell wall biosynthesis
MSRLTTVIMTKNEERNIERCIKSVSGLGAVIVADTGSTDRTKDLAESLGARVCDIPWNGFGPSKQLACDLAETECVLSIDADEVVTGELASSISREMSAGDGADGYVFRRVTNLCGQWILHSGWYPEQVLRLFRKDRARFSDSAIHESIECQGRIAFLDGFLLHFSYPDISAYVSKLKSYALISGQECRRRGGRAAVAKMVTNPPIWFIKKLILQKGFADGIAGLWIASFSAAGQFLKYYYACKGDRR